MEYLPLFPKPKTKSIYKRCKFESVDEETVLYWLRKWLEWKVTDEDYPFKELASSMQGNRLLHLTIKRPFMPHQVGQDLVIKPVGDLYAGKWMDKRKMLRMDNAKLLGMVKCAALVHEPTM